MWVQEIGCLASRFRPGARPPSLGPCPGLETQRTQLRDATWADSSWALWGWDWAWNQKHWRWEATEN